MEVHVPAPKTVVGVQTEQICVFVIAVPQSLVVAIVWCRHSWKRIGR